MVYLGVTIDVISMMLSLSEAKCTSCQEAVKEIIAGKRVQGGVAAPAAGLSSVMHKLLHASS
eukprot:7248568-Prymnesium_polylepis.1